jgi:hypothetical protein
MRKRPGGVTPDCLSRSRSRSLSLSLSLSRSLSLSLALALARTLSLSLCPDAHTAVWLWQVLRRLILGKQK